MPRKKIVKRNITLKPIPVSDAKNALQLVKDVRRAILAQPLRVDMGTVCESRSPEKGGPECGTVGCFAGWVGLLSGLPVQRARRSDTTYAKVLLGTELIYEIQSDSPDQTVDAFDSGDDIDGEIGTKEYAKGVARRIDRFIEANRDDLKERRLVPVAGRLVPVDPEFDYDL